MSKNTSHLTHPVSKARGLGSAKDGTHHWMMQRVTAIALIPLILWFTYSFLDIMVGASRSTVAHWFASPFHAMGTIALLLALFYHAKLGIQVVIEDYVHSESCKIVKLLLLKLVTFALAIISVTAVLKLHIMGI